MAKFKDAYNDKLYDVEEVDSKLFEGTNMQNCCIFCFKDHIDGLHIKYIDGKEENLKCINEKDYSGFTPYEKEIVKYLYNEKPNIVDGDSHGDVKKHLDNYINKRILNKLPDNKFYLIVNATGVQGKANYISSKVGQIFDNKDNLKKWLYDRGGKKCHILYFDTNKSLINCKKSLYKPLLRFPLFKKQSNQSIAIYNYKYIPNIDWSNIESDYDILKACKCPENKIDEYLNYVNNYNPFTIVI